MGGEQGTLEMMNFPREWSMRRSSKRGPCQEETGWPLGNMVIVIVAVVVDVVIIAIVVVVVVVVVLVVVVVISGADLWYTKEGKPISQPETKHVRLCWSLVYQGGETEITTRI